MKKLILSTILFASAILITACSHNNTKNPSTSTNQTTSSTQGIQTNQTEATISSTSSSTVSASIRLESGQATIDYAITILGDKEWIVIEDNYNRTEAIPYNLLQGNDESLYWVYQNGVIYDENNSIVHQP